MAILGLKFFLKNGLKKIDDLPAKTLDEMRLALAFNFNNKEGFLEAMSRSGIDEARLGLIWRNETHDAIENDRLAQAEKKKMSTKTWNTSDDENCCPECKAMDGETVPIKDDFSCGTRTAHLHPNCNCSTTFE